MNFFKLSALLFFSFSCTSIHNLKSSEISPLLPTELLIQIFSSSVVNPFKLRTIAKIFSNHPQLLLLCVEKIALKKIKDDIKDTIYNQIFSLKKEEENLSEFYKKFKKNYQSTYCSLYEKLFLKYFRTNLLLDEKFIRKTKSLGLTNNPFGTITRNDVMDGNHQILANCFTVTITIQKKNYVYLVIRDLLPFNELVDIINNMRQKVEKIVFGVIFLTIKINTPRYTNLVTYLNAKEYAHKIRDQRENSLFHFACHLRDKSMVDTLIQNTEYKVYINTGDDWGDTPLHIICTKYENPTDISSRSFRLPNEEFYDYQESTYTEGTIISQLIKYGANVNTQNKNGETPLFTACQFALYYLTEALLNAGADINSQDDNGNTPLHLIHYPEQQRILSLVLGYKPNIEIQNDNKETAWDIMNQLAGKYSSKETGEMLDLLTRYKESSNTKITLDFLDQVD